MCNVVQAVKGNYFVLSSVHGIQQSDKLAWHQLRFCSYLAFIMIQTPKYFVQNMSTLWSMINLLEVITILT